MNNNSNGKTVFVIILFILFIIVFAGGAIGSTDLTPDTPPAQDAAFAPQFDAQGAELGAELPAGSEQSFLAGSGSSPCGDVYIVQPGDTLTRIAVNCGLTVNDILAANPTITDPHVISVGQQILLFPGASIQPAADPSASGSFDPSLLADPGDSKNPDALFGPASAEQGADPISEPAVDPEDGELPEAQSTPLPGDDFGPGQPATPEPDSFGPSEPVDSVPTVALTPVAPTAAPAQPSGDTLLPDGLVSGGVINVTVRGLPPLTPLAIGIGKVGDAPTMIEERITDDRGELILRLAIPTRARTGEEWVVTVLTRRKPQTTLKSVPFTIQ